MPYRNEDINKLLFPEMQGSSTDVGVAFGARSLSGLIAERTYGLFDEGHFEQIILTGGMPIRQLSSIFGFVSAGKWQEIKPYLKRDFLKAAKEANHMKDLLLKRGISEQKIILCDTDSKNTGQNVTNILSCLKGFNSATLITLGYLQRRAIGTVRLHIPNREELKLTTAPVYPFGINPLNVSNYWFVRQTVKTEMWNLDPDNKKRWFPWPRKGNYHDRGFCVPVDIKAEENALRWS